MHVISMKRLRTFWERHPQSEPSLRRWYKVVSLAQWTNMVATRADFPHADAVTVASGATMTVFNVGGNSYRVVARVLYEFGRVYVKDVLTHAQYSKGQWKERM